MLPSRIWCLPPGLKEINWNLRINWATCYVDPTWPCLWSLESVLHKWLQVQARGCGEWFISSLHRRFSPSSGDNSKMGWNTLHLPACLPAWVQFQKRRYPHNPGQSRVLHQPPKAFTLTITGDLSLNSIIATYQSSPTAWTIKRDKDNKYLRV